MRTASHYKTTTSALALLLAATALPQTGFAQQRDEIIVTAQRRAQSLHEVPIAVTAVSGDFLESIGAVDITDISKLAPNTTIEVARGSSSTIISFIRGIGQQDPVWGFEPGVGIYIDDVYVARPQGAVLDIFDVERVEVLRGPQGTLYGRNTIGGAIKYVTKSLNMSEPELKARINLGSYGQLDEIVTGSLPLSDTFAIGGAVASYSRDGFGTNLNTGADHYNKDVFAARVSAEWAPTDALNFRLAADITQDDSNAKHGHRLLPSADGVFQVTENEYDTRAGVGDDNEVETKGISFTASYDASDKITLKSITAYREGSTTTPIDFDTLPQADLDVPAHYQDDQFSQEFQLLYTNDRISGVAGLYYFDGSAGGDFDVILSALGLTIYQAGNQQKKNLSAYLDFTYDVTDALSISLGGRYTEDKTKADVTREVWLGQGSGSFNSTNTSSIFFVTQTGYSGLERKATKFTPRIAVQYEVSENTNVYASFAQGIKAGGFDPRARADLDPFGLSREGFGAETVDSYEIGVKGFLFDNRVSYSLAGFVADYTDQQITVQQGVDTDNDGVNDTFISSVFNAGKSKYKGIEFESSIRLSDDFTLMAMGGYIDTDIKEILSGGANIAGNFVTQNTPELTARLGFAYDHDLGNHGGLLFTGSMSYRDKYYLSNVPLQGFGANTRAGFAQAGPALDPGAYTVVDLGVTWTSENGRWDLGLYGRNLTDERARIAGYNLQLGADGAYSAFYRAPRTFTASLGFKY
ncbi:MAG: TonB-dependent receptor [Robiginitomaculum sp.]|nr:MAG: TonB-dependent receptor [Robiginitomaculum sp.]